MRLLFHVVAEWAEFERELAAERTRTALASARASGKSLGRSSRVSEVQRRLIHQMRQAGHSRQKIAKSTGLSRSAVAGVLPGEIASLAGFTPGERNVGLADYER